MTKKRKTIRRVRIDDKVVSERDYVLALSEAASDYLELVIRAPYVEDEDTAVAVAAMERWEARKTKLSPHTLMAMADAWLERDDINKELQRFAKLASKLP